MISSRWHRQNGSFLYSGPAIIIAIYLLVGMLFNSFGLERNWLTLLISTLITIVATLLAFALMKLRAKSMTRALKMEKDAALFALRMMFKDKQIRYNQQLEDDISRFEFHGQSLTMTVQPYFLHNFVFGPKNNPQPATLVILNGLEAHNQSFADLLTESIDEMAKQQPNKWNNA